MKYIRLFEEENLVIDDLTKDTKFLDRVEQELGKEYTDIESIEDLNDGYCIVVANYLAKKYNGKIFTIGNGLSYHVITKINDKFYDAVDVQGVKNVEDLQWSKGTHNIANTLKAGIAFTH